MAKTSAVSVKLVGGKPVAVTGAAALSPAAIPKDLEQAKKVALALVLSLQPTVTGMVIEDEEQYRQADLMLGQLKQGRRGWGEVIGAITGPISQGLQKLYALNRSVDRPMEDLEKLVKRAMADYKLEELRQQRAEEEAKAQERQRLLAKQSALVSPAAKAKVEEKLQALDEQPVMGAVVGEHSAPALLRKVRVTDLVAFCRGIGSGLIPADLVEVRVGALNTMHRGDRETVESWPGLGGYDDVNIARR